MSNMATCSILVTAAHGSLGRNLMPTSDVDFVNTEFMGWVLLSRVGNMIFSNGTVRHFLVLRIARTFDLLMPGGLL